MVTCYLRGSVLCRLLFDRHDNLLVDAMTNELILPITKDAPPLHLTYWRWAMEELHNKDAAVNFERNQRKAVAKFMDRFGEAPTMCFVGQGWIGLAPVPEGMTK